MHWPCRHYKDKRYHLVSEKAAFSTFPKGCCDTLFFLTIFLPKAWKLWLRDQKLCYYIAGLCPFWHGKITAPNPYEEHHAPFTGN